MLCRRAATDTGSFAAVPALALAFPLDLVLALVTIFALAGGSETSCAGSGLPENVNRTNANRMGMLPLSTKYDSFPPDSQPIRGGVGLT